MNVCRGVGCSRANCNGGDSSDDDEGCMEGKTENVECVTECVDVYDHQYCFDCRVSKCEHDDFDCAKCSKLVGPLLLKQNKMLRTQLEK